MLVGEWNRGKGEERESSEPPVEKINKTKRKKTKLIAIVLIILLALFSLVYLYSRYNQSQKASESQTKGEVGILVEKVSKLMELPKNEVPTIATVADKTKLTNQAFFANAQNGDKVLIYSLAKKAILYRPSINKIIEVAPVNITEQLQTTPTTSPSPTTKTVKIAIYNGTTNIGLTVNAEKQIKTKIKDLNIIVKDMADKDDYTNTIIYDLSGEQSEVTNQIADIVRGEVSTMSATTLNALPSYKDAQIIVILGEDYKQL